VVEGAWWEEVKKTGNLFKNEGIYWIRALEGTRSYNREKWSGCRRSPRHRWLLNGTSLVLSSGAQTPRYGEVRGKNVRLRTPDQACKYVRACVRVLCLLHICLRDRRPLTFVIFPSHIYFFSLYIMCFFLFLLAVSFSLSLSHSFCIVRVRFCMCSFIYIIRLDTAVCYPHCSITIRPAKTDYIRLFLFTFSFSQYIHVQSHTTWYISKLL